jgi:hypothetical protein
MSASGITRGVSDDPGWTGQAWSTSADAFSGSSTKTPGITTLAVNSVVVAPATTVSLGCVRGGNYFVPVQLSGDAFSYEAAIP